MFSSTAEKPLIFFPPRISLGKFRLGKYIPVILTLKEREEQPKVMANLG